MAVNNQHTDTLLKSLTRDGKNFLKASSEQVNKYKIVPNKMISSNPIKFIEEIEMPSFGILSVLRDYPNINIQDKLIECEKNFINCLNDESHASARNALEMLKSVTYIDELKFLKPLENPFDTNTPNAPSDPEEIDELNETRIFVLTNIKEITKIYSSIIEKSKIEIPDAVAEEIPEATEVEEIKKESAEIVQDNLVHTNLKEKPSGNSTTESFFNRFKNRFSRKNKVAVVDNDNIVEAVRVPGGKRKTKKHHKKKKTRRVRKQRKSRK